MKREIKFRAWIKTGNETDDFVKPMTIQQMIHSKESTFSLAQLNNLVDFEQYTGVDDADGGPIYEGDILQDVNDGIIVGAVTYDDKEGMYECNKNCMYDVSDCKVVGNIHMNPELLEEELR